jgi:membrane protease YdiL (CAAX protease family)
LPVSHPLLSLILLVVLLLVIPVRSWLGMRRRKQLNAAVPPTRGYLVTIATLWLLALLAKLVTSSDLWTPPGRLTADFLGSSVPPGMLIAASMGLMLVLLAPLVAARLKPESVERQLAPIRFMLPTTMAQRWLFVLVCLTAGIAEEWIYRGFVLHYLSARLPDFTGWIVLVVAASLFGIAHVYQGWLGVMMTGALGLFFCVLYLDTGSLLVPMLLHTLIDLRILLLRPMLRPATA